MIMAALLRVQLLQIESLGIEWLHGQCILFAWPATAWERAVVLVADWEAEVVRDGGGDRDSSAGLGGC